MGIVEREYMGGWMATHRSARCVTSGGILGPRCNNNSSYSICHICLITVPLYMLLLPQTQVGLQFHFIRYVSYSTLLPMQTFTIAKCVSHGIFHVGLQ